MTKLYGLCIARDEADVIGEALTHALGNCEKIICMDNMSSDATWDIMQEMAATHKGRIIAHARIDEPFTDGLRARAYNAYHRELSSRDWWLRLDADEFLHEASAPIIATANAENADFIRANQMNFFLTERDVVEGEQGLDDKSRPIALRRKYYRVNWREFRLFRNDPLIGWDIAIDPQFPQGLSKQKIASREIFNRHYGNRDAEQLKRRVAIRAGSASFAHVASEDWRQYVEPASRCHIYRPGDPVRYSPLVDFWPRRIGIEIAQRSQKLRRIASRLPAVLTGRAA